MKGRLLSGTMPIAPPPTEPEDDRPRKPIPSIGTMRKDATPEQRRAFHRMKQQMKRAARNIRHDQHLREQKARDKP